MKILGFNITKARSSTEVVVNEQTLYRMLLETMSPYLKLRHDSNLLSVVTDGYESSPNVFSITNKVATMFSQVPYKVFKGEKEIDQDPIKDLIEIDGSDLTLCEFMQKWEIFGLTLGEAITYNLFRSGIGELIHIQLVPSHHVEMIFGNIMQPIKGYNLDLGSNDKMIIPPENIWHTRLFPNLDFREGKNYRGLSPVRVAARVINSEIFGSEIVENTFKRGMPTGILSREDEEGFAQKDIEEQRKNMESIWKRKYAQRSRSGLPIFTVGKMKWTPISFSSFTDLQVAEINKLALRTLCNIWGIPSRVMNDMEGGSYTKDKEDRKAIYTNRIQPDLKLFWAGVNKLIKPSGLRYEADYSNIPELQDDKETMAKIYQIGYQCNTVTINEFREQLQLESDPEMDGLYRNDVETSPFNQPQLPPDKI